MTLAHKHQQVLSICAVTEYRSIVRLWCALPNLRGFLSPLDYLLYNPWKLFFKFLIKKKLFHSSCGLELTGSAANLTLVHRNANEFCSTDTVDYCPVVSVWLIVYLYIRCGVLDVCVHVCVHVCARVCAPALCRSVHGDRGGMLMY